MLGVFGVGPDGSVPLKWRGAGLFSVVIGIMYWLPNEKIFLHRKIYLSLALLPVAGLIAMSVYEMLLQGIDSSFVTDLAIGWVALTICLLLAAPVSLILYSKSRQKN